MSILKYMLADKEAKAETREDLMDFLKHSNTYKMGAGIGNFAKDMAGNVSDFVSDITFEPLPYGESIRHTYDGIQNLYGNTLDRGLDKVIDYFTPNPITSGGPLSRGSRYMNDLTFVPGSNMNRMTNSYYNAEEKRIMDDILSGKEIFDYPKIEANPVIKTPLGALEPATNFDSYKPDISDKSIDQIVSEYNEEQERLKRNYNSAGERILGGR